MAPGVANTVVETSALQVTHKLVNNVLELLADDYAVTGGTPIFCEMIGRRLACNLAQVRHELKKEFSLARQRAQEASDQWERDRLAAQTAGKAPPAAKTGMPRRSKKSVEWKWLVDGFERHGVKYPLTGQPLKLLKAFVAAKGLGNGYVLTHQQINNACSDGLTERAGGYVAELNKALCALWHLETKPITPIHREKSYRFAPPPVTDSTS